MRCPHCDSRTKVIETRHPDHSGRLAPYSAAGRAQATVGCYTSNWIARKRRCLSSLCEKRFVTVEVSIDDLEKEFEPKDLGFHEA